MAGSQTMTEIANHTHFLNRVNYMMKKAAVAVMAEDAQTANHADRVTYAKAILDGTASVPEFSRAVVTNATLTAAGSLDTEDHGISDNDLEFTVNSMFNAMAGVST